MNIPTTVARGVVNPNPSESRSIHVGNLSPYIDANMLRTIFGCIGKIQDCRIAKGGKYGFIDFYDPETARTALNLNGTEIGGQRIRVELTQTKRVNPVPSSQSVDKFNPLAALGLNPQLQHQILTAVAQVIQRGMDSGLSPMASVLAAFSSAGLQQQNLPVPGAGSQIATAALPTIATPVPSAVASAPAHPGLLGEKPGAVASVQVETPQVKTEVKTAVTTEVKTEGRPKIQKRSRSRSQSKSSSSSSSDHRRRKRSNRRKRGSDDESASSSSSSSSSSSDESDSEYDRRRSNTKRKQRSASPSNKDDKNKKGKHGAGLQHNKSHGKVPADQIKKETS